MAWGRGLGLRWPGFDVEGIYHRGIPCNLAASLLINVPRIDFVIYRCLQKFMCVCTMAFYVGWPRRASVQGSACKVVAALLVFGFWLWCSLGKGSLMVFFDYL